MAKDILLYGSIWQYQAMYFFDQIKEALEDGLESDLNLRINCEGGSPEYGMSVITKVQEMADQFSITVEAMAHSIALFILCYVNTEKVSCIDTAQAVLHRAAYPGWMEKDSDFKDSIYASILAKTNKDLEKAFRAKVDVSVLEALPQFAEKNIKLKDIFSMESRIDVLLTASDLKKLGLVSKIVKITPSKSAELKSAAELFANCKSLEDVRMAAQAINPQVDEPLKITNMTAAELKEKFPLVYAFIKAEGHTEGVTAGLAQEKERIEAIMVFNEIDPIAVSAAIESGKPLTQKALNELMLKSAGKNLAASVKTDSTGKVITEVSTTPETEKAAKLAAFNKEVDTALGKKPALVTA